MNTKIITILIPLYICLLAGCTESDNRTSLEKASWFLVHGKDKKALVEVEKALEKKPNSVDALKLKSMILFAINDFHNANVYIDKAIAMSYESDPELFVIKGTLYDEYRNDTTLALIEYSKALSIDSVYTPALQKRGWLFTRFGLYEKALEDFKKIIEIEPQQEQVIFLIDRIENDDYQYFEKENYGVPQNENVPSV